MIYFLYKITHLPSGKVEWLGSEAGCWYRMGDGSLLKVHSLPAWCGRCGRVTNGESLGSIQEVEKQLEELRDPEGLAKLGPMFARAEADVVGDLEREWERRLEWRRGRKSPAKCLECGGVVVGLPWDRAVPHPGGGGEVLVHMESMGGTSPRDETFYTPEGDRIGEEDGQEVEGANGDFSDIEGEYGGEEDDDLDEENPCGEWTAR